MVDLFQTNNGHEDKKHREKLNLESFKGQSNIFVVSPVDVVKQKIHNLVIEDMSEKLK